MQTIYKYDIPLSAGQGLSTDSSFTLDIPEEGEVLSVAAQHNKPVMWVFVDTEAEVKPRKFRVATTGNPYPGGMKWKAGDECYSGTIILHEGTLVIHIFEVWGLLEDDE